MSIYVTSAAWKNSRATGSTLLLLLAICDFADDEGVAFPAMKTLARKARISERTAQYGVAELVGLGELGIQHEAGPYGCNLYRVHIEAMRGGADSAGVQDLRGCNPVRLGGATHCTQTTIEPSGSGVKGSKTKKAQTPKAAPIGFDLTAGKFTNLDAQSAMDLKAAYPSVNLDAAVNRAAIWIVANPGKRPVSKFGRFLTSWLGREQNRIDMLHAVGGKPQANFMDQRKAFLDELTGNNAPTTSNVIAFKGETIDG